MRASWAAPIAWQLRQKHMNLRNDHYTWPIALVFGSVIIIALFATLRELRFSQAVPESVVEIDFIQWHESALKAKSNKVISAPVTAKISHVIQQPLPKVNPINAPVAREPVVAEQPDTLEPLPVKQQAERPETSPESDQTEFLKKKNASSEDFPVPAPIFQLTSMPRFAHRVEPQYPLSMRSLGREAQVKLDVLVDANGKVRKVTVLQSGGDKFDEAAKAALLESVFIPGNIKGKSVAVSMHIPITFRLN